MIRPLILALLLAGCGPVPADTLANGPPIPGTDPRDVEQCTAQPRLAWCRAACGHNPGAAWCGGD